ncbi:hypothetical protein ACOME3_001571 [Neoechinorhynchus agilis]
MAAVPIMDRIDLKDVARVGVLMEIKPDIMRTVLDAMNPGLCAVFLISRKLKIEHNHISADGIKYSIDKLSKDCLDTWTLLSENPRIDQDFVLQLPSKNEYVPNLDEVIAPKSADNVPVLVNEESGFRCWHKYENCNKRVGVKIMCQLPEDELWNAQKAVAIDIAFQIIVMKTKERMLNALCMKYVFVEEKETRRMTFYLEGFTDKMDTFVEEMLKIVIEVKNDAECFENAKDAQIMTYIEPIRDTQFVCFQEAWNVAGIGINFCNENLLEQASYLEYEIFKSTWNDLFKRQSCDVYIIGEVEKEQAVKISKTVYDHFKELGTIQPTKKMREIVFKTKSNLRKRFISTNVFENSILLLFQCDRNTVSHSALSNIFVQSIKENFIDFVMMNDETVSSIFTGSVDQGKSIYVYFFEQSRQSCEYSDASAELFLEDVYDALKTMTEEDLDRVKTKVIIQLKDEGETLTEKLDYWSAFVDEYGANFDRKTKLIKEVESTCKKDLLEFYTKFIQRSSNSRIKLATYLSPINAPVETYQEFGFLKISEYINSATEIEDTMVFLEGKERVYADLIKKAINSSPEKRLKLREIYSWIEDNNVYFNDPMGAVETGDSVLLNAIRHNSSLRKIIKIEQDDGPKRSWLQINLNYRDPERKDPGRKRANLRSINDDQNKHARYSNEPRDPVIAVHREFKMTVEIVKTNNPVIVHQLQLFIL